jgi:hypothetical protein
VSKKALPFAIQLAQQNQQNFDLTLALLNALGQRARTPAEIEAQEARRRGKWGDTLDKRDARSDAMIRAIKSLPPKFQPIVRGGERKWPHGAQKAVKAHMETVDGIFASPTWLSWTMNVVLRRGDV